MFGKIIDERLVVAGRIVKDGNKTITNPTEEKLKELGYKTIEYTEKPTFNKEEEKLKEVYTDGDKITVSYEKVELSAEEHNAIIQAEIVAEEQKITARNYREAIKDLKAKKETSYALDKIDVVENNIVELRAKLREITNEE